MPKNMASDKVYISSKKTETTQLENESGNRKVFL